MQCVKMQIPAFTAAAHAAHFPPSLNTTQRAQTSTMMKGVWLRCALTFDKTCRPTATDHKAAQLVEAQCPLRRTPKIGVVQESGKPKKLPIFLTSKLYNTASSYTTVGSLGVRAPPSTQFNLITLNRETASLYNGQKLEFTGVKS
jgi:hypothetical protein